MIFKEYYSRLTNLVGRGAVKRIHCGWVGKPPKQNKRNRLDMVYLNLTGFKDLHSFNLLCALDCFPQPADVSLSYKLECLHDIPKVIRLIK